MNRCIIGAASGSSKHRMVIYCKIGANVFQHTLISLSMGHLNICPLCGAASEYSESSQAVAGGPARAGKHALVGARARMPYNFSTKNSLR